VTKNLTQCETCPLKDNVYVPSELHDSKIVALAEAPGYHEAQNGRPLVGVAGQDYNRIVEAIGATREKFATLVNAVSCRPTKVENGREKNRTPTDEEIACCKGRLEAELENLSPSVIVTMGRIPYLALGGKTWKGWRMLDVVGGTFLWKGIPVIVTYHPAAISHAGGLNTDRGKMTRDKIQEALAKALEYKPPADRQLGMFDE